MKIVRLALLAQLAWVCACNPRSPATKQAETLPMPPPSPAAQGSIPRAVDESRKLEAAIAQNLARSPGAGYETTVMLDEKGEADFRLAFIFYRKATSQKVLDIQREMIAFAESPDGPKLLWRQNSNDLEMGLDVFPEVSYRLDFNGDGKKDVFLQQGLEDWFSTALFLNELPKGLTRTFVTNAQYSVIVDMNQDGTPELLNYDPAFRRRFTDRDNGDYCGWGEKPEEMHRDAAQEYERIAKNYRSMNFDYNLDKPEFILLSAFEKITVKGFDAGNPKRLVDQTARFAEHIQWRIQFLEKFGKHIGEQLATLEPSDPKDKASPYYQTVQCQKKIQQLLAYYQSIAPKKNK